MTKKQQLKLPKNKLTQKQEQHAQRAWDAGRLLADEIDLKSATKEHLLYSIKLQERFLQDYEHTRWLNETHILDLQKIYAEARGHFESTRLGYFKKIQKVDEENKLLKKQLKKLREELN